MIVLSIIAALASLATLAVVLLRPVCRPIDYAELARRIADLPTVSPVVSSEHRISRGQDADAPHPHAGARSVHVLKTGPRFWIEAVDGTGQTIVGVDHRSDDETDIGRRWTRLQQSSDVGTFTLHDSQNAGHRGRFSRGVE